MLEAHVQGPWTISGNAELTAARAAAGNRQLIPGLEEGEVYLSSLDRQQEAIREQGHASSVPRVSCCVFFQLNTTRGHHGRPCKAPWTSTRRRLGGAQSGKGRALQLEDTPSALLAACLIPTAAQGASRVQHELFN